MRGDADSILPMRSLVALVAIACAFVTLPSPTLSAQADTNSGTQNPVQTTAPSEQQPTSSTAGPAVAGSPYGFGLGLGLGLGLGSQPMLNPLTQPTLTPGMLHLMELETKFAAAVAAGGGP